MIPDSFSKKHPISDFDFDEAHFKKQKHHTDIEGRVNNLLNNYFFEANRNMTNLLESNQQMDFQGEKLGKFLFKFINEHPEKQKIWNGVFKKITTAKDPYPFNFSMEFHALYLHASGRLTVFTLKIF